MTSSSLTAERLREMLEYDPSTGVFRWRVAAGRWGRIPAGTVAGGRNTVNGYVHIVYGGTQHKAHRLAWLYMTGEWPRHEIDHINRIRADNRFANLREVTTAQNLKNKNRYRSNTSGYPGVNWHAVSCKWVARIGVGSGKRISLGYWNTAKEAAAAYAEAKAKFHTITCNT